MEKAVNELRGSISERFPQASFVVEEGFDPKGIYLVTTVDIADTDEVIDETGWWSYRLMKVCLST